MGTFNIVPLGSIVVSKHALGFLLLCSMSVCSVYHDLRLPPCLCERSSILSVSFGVRKPAGTRTSVEALQTVTSKSDQLVNCRWSTGVGRLGPRHDKEVLAYDDFKVEEPYYEIEKILRWRKVKRGRKILKEYLVLWKGYPNTEASWIQAKQFSHPNQLQQYLEDDQPLQERV